MKQIKAFFLDRKNPACLYTLVLFLMNAALLIVPGLHGMRNTSVSSLYESMLVMRGTQMRCFSYSQYPRLSMIYASSARGTMIGSAVIGLAAQDNRLMDPYFYLAFGEILFSDRFRQEGSLKEAVR